MPRVPSAGSATLAAARRLCVTARTVGHLEWVKDAAGAAVIPNGIDLTI
jgi:hypothetical protein